MTITIDVSDTYDRVRRIASFVGRSLIGEDGKPMYDKLRITEQDRVLIDEYCIEAVSSVADIAHLFLESVEENYITLDLPFIGAKYQRVLSTCVRNYIMNWAAAQWLAINQVDGSTYMNIANSNINKINKIIFLKTKPQKNGKQS